MNTNQREMLALKNDVERKVQYYFNTTSTPKEAHTATCRYVAGLFAKYQIELDYQVKLTKRNHIEIQFTAYGNIATIDVMPPIRPTGWTPALLPPLPTLPPPITEDVVQSLHEYLTANQQSLGSDYSKVLYDNLWELYEAVDTPQTEVKELTDVELADSIFKHKIKLGMAARLNKSKA
jgi:hypothetical protein